MEEEEKASDPLSGLSHDEKQQSMKSSLENLISQLEPSIKSTGERRNLDKLRQLLPLYDKHNFWDTQPVPKNLNVTDVGSHCLMI